MYPLFESYVCILHVWQSSAIAKDPDIHNLNNSCHSTLRLETLSLVQWLSSSFFTCRQFVKPNHTLTLIPDSPPRSHTHSTSHHTLHRPPPPHHYPSSVSPPSSISPPWTACAQSAASTRPRPNPPPDPPHRSPPNNSPPLGRRQLVLTRPLGRQAPLPRTRRRLVRRPLDRPHWS